jgi:hypothetical protein
MDSGTSFNADLRRPLAFGSEPLTPAVLEHIGTLPASVHAGYYHSNFKVCADPADLPEWDTSTLGYVAGSRRFGPCFGEKDLSEWGEL